MKFTKLFAAIALTATLAACGQQAVSDNSLEEARMTAKANAEFNAQIYRASNPRFTSDFNIVGRSDTTQKVECPQGDGWASMDLVNPNDPKATLGLKCSTVSDAVGCRESKDFKTSPYANEDGRCQATTKVPHPLPKIAK